MDVSEVFEVVIFAEELSQVTVLFWGLIQGHLREFGRKVRHIYLSIRDLRDEGRRHAFTVDLLPVDIAEEGMRLQLVDAGLPAPNPVRWLRAQELLKQIVSLRAEAVLVLA